MNSRYGRYLPFILYALTAQRGGYEYRDYELFQPKEITPEDVEKEKARIRDERARKRCKGRGGQR